ncbi:MAG: hypothetical protein RR054_04080 [Clostridia bacterium]
MKRRIIVIFSVLSIIALLIVLNCTVFTVKNVDFVFKNQNNQTIDAPTGLDKQAMLECLYAFKGKNILFMKKSDVRNVVESKFCKIKVIDVVKQFPDSMTMYFIQRQNAFYYIDDNNVYYVCDNEMRIIEVTNAATSGIRLLGIKNEELGELKLGGFFNFKKDSQWKNDIYLTISKVFWQLGYDYGQQGNLFSLINIEKSVQGDNYTLTLETTVNGEFVLANPTVNLTKRLVAAYGVFCDDKAAKDATYYINENGQVTILP